MQPIIEVSDLSKKYSLGSYKPYQTLRDAIVGFFNKDPRKQNLKKGEFWALENLSFSVYPGEVIGVIGRNGAGKSTLLKILSRITLPTSGQAILRGRVASLLEVGTGFNPELTGRENIFLNGAILGMSRSEINNKLDEIILFAEIKKFIDTPVKYYSSGMYTRLAFAVAANLDPEILIVDEVLSVGDVRFQKKSLGKMANLTKNQGKTIFFVSHNLGAIKELCSRTLLLEDGKLIYNGDTDEAIRLYIKENSERKCGFNLQGNLVDSLKIEEVTINGKFTASPVIFPQDEIEIRIIARISNKVSDFFAELSIYIDGIRLTTLTDVIKSEDLPKGLVEFSYKIPSYFLRPGDYSVGFGGHQPLGGGWMWGDDLTGFQVAEIWDKRNLQSSKGIVNIPYTSGRLIIKNNKYKHEEN